MIKEKVFEIACQIGLSTFTLCSSLSATIFHVMDTTIPLHCHFSSKYQNRIMIDKGYIQKVIALDEEKLSIFMEDFSGQVFISNRDPYCKETTLAVVAKTGIIQDVQITFDDRSSEVVVLTDLEFEKTEENCEMSAQLKSPNNVMAIVSNLLIGNIPSGYVPCQIDSKQWKPKKGVVLETLARLEGCNDTIYVYQICNTTPRKRKILESELQFEGCQWVFLEGNTLFPKQKILGIVSVGRL